jgi:uncharacterized protein involved in exopolysaccharide biosynthesis
MKEVNLIDDQDGERDGLASAEAAPQGLLTVALIVVAHRWLLFLGPILAGSLALCITYLISPTFTARTVFLPPQQQQSAAASAIASLGALSGLAGAAAGIRSPGEQYVALMYSNTVSDHIIDEFKLMTVYNEDYRDKARFKLAKNVRISLGKKDGLVSVEVDDVDPERAAMMANSYVDELRRLSQTLVLTEAQQRRLFFSTQLERVRDKLSEAQKTLQASGFNPDALKSEPRAAAEGYAKLRAESTAAEVRLDVLRRTLLDGTPEVQQALSTVAALRIQLGKLEQASEMKTGPDYVSKYREFKYQESLFEIFARQYELARVDESREGPLIQVVDVATPPERKSRPQRLFTALASAVVSLIFLLGFIFARKAWQRTMAAPENAEVLAQIRADLHGTR